MYTIKAMVFGAISLSVAQFVKNKNASLFEHEHPGIRRAVETQHSVDDYLDSCMTEQEAIRRIETLVYVHRQAEYEMVKWVSNSNAVLRSIPESIRADSSATVEIDSQHLERILGYLGLQILTSLFSLRI